MATKVQAERFKIDKIRPALHTIKMWSLEMEELLLGTALAESNLKDRTQQPSGPARSFFQIELRTHDDIWDTYLKYHKDLAALVTTLLTSPDADKHIELENNDQYAAALSCIWYVRRHVSLPKAGNLAGMAKCWEKVYNVKGKGRAERYIDVWNATMKR
jgi:hypothetical protein